MEYTVVTNPNDVEVKMSGQFTFHHNEKFKELVTLVDMDGLESIIINLHGVEFIDSAGLGMLLLLRDYCEKHHMNITLNSPRGQVERILTLSKFDQLFTVKP